MARVSYAPLSCNKLNLRSTLNFSNCSTISYFHLASAVVAVCCVRCLPQHGALVDQLQILLMDTWRLLLAGFINNRFVKTRLWCKFACLYLPARLQGNKTLGRPRAMLLDAMTQEDEWMNEWMMFLLTCDKKLTKSQLNPTHASN